MPIPMCRIDMETAFNRIAPEDQPFVHTLEGPDDMPAHVKASLLGSSLSVPVANGRLCTLVPGKASTFVNIAIGRPVAVLL